MGITSRRCGILLRGCAVTKLLVKWYFIRNCSDKIRDYGLWGSLLYARPRIQNTPLVKYGYVGKVFPALAMLNASEDFTEELEPMNN